MPIDVYRGHEIDPPIWSGKLAHGAHPVLASAIRNAASQAFFNGFHAANYVVAGVAAAGALTALALLPAQPNLSSGEELETQALASPATAAANS
jgi:hypothetical protein